MRNIAYTISKDGAELTIKVDLRRDFGPSVSKKSITIATTEGEHRLDSEKDIYMGLHVSRRPSKPLEAK